MPQGRVDTAGAIGAAALGVDPVHLLAEPGVGKAHDPTAAAAAHRLVFPPCSQAASTEHHFADDRLAQDPLDE